MRRSWAAVLAVALLAAAAGAYFQARNQRAIEPVNGLQLLEKLPVADPDGRAQIPGQWRGKVLVVNFWATWCEPCRKEIPALIRVQARNVSKGVQIVGIAVDSADKVRQFAIEYRIGYPLVIGSMAVIDLTRKLGNKAAGLPYTVVLDRSGRVIKTHLGGISEVELESAIRLASG